MAIRDTGEGHLRLVAHAFPYGCDTGVAVMSTVFGITRVL